MLKLVLVLSLAVIACAKKYETRYLDMAIAEISGSPDTLQNQSNLITNNRASTIVPPSSSNEVVNAPCETNDNKAGICVIYYQCNANDTINTDGEDIIDIRASSTCPSYLDVCCLTTHIRDTDNPQTPKPDVQVQKEGCGWRNPNGVGFRTTGDVDNESKFGEFPWMAAVLKVEPENENEPNRLKQYVFLGGGSLIHPSVVLTAAHKVFSAKAIRVRVGEWDVKTTKEIYPHQDRDVTEAVIHKDFYKGNLHYDIALLFLASPLQLAPNVGVACLPPPNGKTPGGTRCFSSGWGKDKFDEKGRYQTILKKIKVPVVDNSQCQKRLRNTRLGRHYQLHDSFMCAGGEIGEDMCKGDGGSPLVCPIEFESERYVQSGIVSWGIGCGADGTPGIYVDVGYLRSWIDDKMTDHGLSISTYEY